MVAPKGLRYAFYGAWALALTGLTYVLGAIPLKVLRTWAGRAGYWAGGGVLSLLLVMLPSSASPLGWAFLSLLVLVGTFAELEETGLSLAATAFFTLLINVLLTAGAFALWIYAAGRSGWRDVLIGGLERTLKPVTDLNPALAFDYPALVGQLPSILVILWLAALYLAVLLEDKLGGRGGYRAQLAEYRNPDAVTWVFIASLLGAFGHFFPPIVETIANNALNVTLLLFFFQGIAVVTRVLTGFKMNTALQAVVMVVIVLHLFWFVSVIGLSDHWLDFRGRLKKRSEAV
jgi:hypothetical protein